MSEKGNSPESNSDKTNSKTIVLPQEDKEIMVFVHSRTISSIEGIGNIHLKRLRETGIKSLNSLLQRAGTRKGRRETAMEVGASEKQVLEWVVRADIQRVPGVGPDYADLLESAGVDTVQELARRNPVNLHSKMLEVNELKNVVRKPPAKKQVEKWVSNAKMLPRVVEY